MLAYMKRTTVKISDDLDARLRHEAARRRVTVSDLTREALEAYLPGDSSHALGFEGVGASGRSDVAERIEEILRGELAP
jgi:Ribbon-helix-helix protein, copG family